MLVEEVLRHHQRVVVTSGGSVMVVKEMWCQGVLTEAGRVLERV